MFRCKDSRRLRLRVTAYALDERKGKRMKKKLTLTLGLLLLTVSAVAVVVPVSDLQAWTALSYRNIPANKVSVTNGGLHIVVKQSASPLVYKFDAPLTVSSLHVKARWAGELRIPENAVQGDTNADDSVLKLGVVEAGDRTLNWLQRRIAADWIKQLFRLAPQGTGVGRIHFLSTSQQENQLGSQRVHPLNDLLYETRITYLDKPGAFEMAYQFEQPVVLLGLWISADGDDTGSSFELTIDNITVITD